MAYCRIEPFGRSWEQSATISQQIALLRHTVASSHSAEFAEQLNDTVEFDRYMPGEYSPPKPPSKPMDAAQMQSHFAGLAAAHARR